jgi:hypothetical protein
MRRLYLSSDCIKRSSEEVRDIAHIREIRNECKTSVGKPEGNSSFDRPRLSSENNIKMGLKETLCEG